MSQASVHYFQKNQIVFYENSSNTSLYKIISGTIALYEHYGTADERLIGTTTAPNYFGMMSALSGGQTAYTAVAMETAAVLHLPQAQLETFPKSDCTNALACMQNLARELWAADKRFDALLHELHQIAHAGADVGKELSALLTHYTGTGRRILDAYTKPEPPKEPETLPVAELEPTPQLPVEEKTTTEKIVISENTPRRTGTAMPEPYLEGHTGYPGVTRPEDEKYLLKQEFTCPNCRRKFSGERIRNSKLIPRRDTAEEKRYDLRVRYRDFEAEWHEIVTCPHCYFSALESFFKDNKSLYHSRYEKTLEKMRESVKVQFGSEQDLDSVFARHYLALVCAPGFTDWRQINAHVWMNLARLYEDAGEPMLADIAEQTSLEAYQKVYMEVDLTEGQEQRLCLIIAGILYARGDKMAAREWAVRVRHGSDDRTAYWNMAEQLIQDVRAEMEKAK